MLKNKIFTVTFDKKNGGISELKLNNDDNNMNFVKKGHSLNAIMLIRKINGNKPKNMEMTDFCEKESCARAVWKDDSLTVIADYRFTEGGNIKVSNRFKNESNIELFFEQAQVGVVTPFADEYPGAKECMTNRCHTHIWCGLSGASYVCCLKMGNEEENIGLLTTKGGFESYSQFDTKSNDRGWFLLHPDMQIIKPKEEYILEYEIFPCKNKEDFLEICKSYNNFININAKTYSIFQGEKIEFKVESGNLNKLEIRTFFRNPMSVKEWCENTKECIESSIEILLDSDNNARLVCMPREKGEYKFVITTEFAQTIAIFQVLQDMNELLKKRVGYIVDYQQFHNKSSHLDGAYLVCDTENKTLVYDRKWPDCNASRERIGMGILIAYFLQTNNDCRVYESLMKYEEFVRREIYDDETGRIYDEITKDDCRDRLYNYLWVALFYVEIYKLTKKTEYLQDVLKIVRCYYDRGGINHYPNAVFLSDILEVFRGREEYEELKTLFLNHAKEIIKKGSNYPKHEVNYEQTIVAPAVAIILDAIEYCNENMKEPYKKELLNQILRLERFDGFAPHYKLNEVAIRYWDAYWFGKSHIYGDTLPHYWSCLSSINYLKTGLKYGMDKYIEKGKEGLKACLCMFFEDGGASCASVFPYMLNGRRGEFMDKYANDQDFALYYGARFLN